MKFTRKLIVLLLFAVILSACSNIPQIPTKTPTMSPDELIQAAQATAEVLRRETETQWAIENPSPTPTDTATPTPEATPTSALPMIPPTATAEALPYLRVGYKNATVYKIGDPGDYVFVPMDNLYIEICYTNDGSGTWNENYYAMCTNMSGSVITPDGVNRLGKSVSNGQKACFSFNRQGSPNTALGTQCPGFQLYTDTGIAVRDGYISACFNIQ
ncbi:MAG: hypothetical protein IKP86_02090 [Anaerolineaceae bacterium]|nr:hypothetical protein [Anaerolineaceae bacterium]